MCDCFPWATIASTRVPNSVMEIVIKAICAENFSVHPNHHRDISARDQLEARDPHYNNRRRPHFLGLPGWDATVTGWDTAMPRRETAAVGRGKIDITTSQDSYHDYPYQESSHGFVSLLFGGYASGMPALVKRSPSSLNIKLF